MLRPLVFAAAAVAITACSPKGPAQPSKTGGPITLSPLAKLNTDLAMDEFMGHVVDPAAFVYWAGSGTVETAKGEQDLSPTTDEGWEKLESAAAALIEAGNDLQLPGRERHLPDHPDIDWYQHAQKLSQLAVVAKAAAEKHDKAGVYTSGAAIYEECTACHWEYKIQPDLKANGYPQGNPLPDWPADVKARQQAYSARK